MGCRRAGETAAGGVVRLDLRAQEHLGVAHRGRIAETRRMIDFSGRHSITAGVEVIPIQKVNEANER